MTAKETNEKMARNLAANAADEAAEVEGEEKEAPAADADAGLEAEAAANDAADEKAPVVAVGDVPEPPEDWRAVVDALPLANAEKEALKAQIVEAARYREAYAPYLAHELIAAKFAEKTFEAAEAALEALVKSERLAISTVEGAAAVASAQLSQDAPRVIVRALSEQLAPRLREIAESAFKDAVAETNAKLDKSLEHFEQRLERAIDSAARSSVHYAVGAGIAMTAVALSAAIGVMWFVLQ